MMAFLAAGETGTESVLDSCVFVRNRESWPRFEDSTCVGTVRAGRVERESLDQTVPRMFLWILECWIDAINSYSCL
jgi:hypothetical protein